MTLEEFEDAIKDFELHPVTVCGEVCGAILVHGAEIHACIKPNGFGRWARRGLIPILQTVIDKYGYATTAVAEGNEIGRKFVERMGFKYVKTEDKSMRYRMETFHGR